MPDKKITDLVDGDPLQPTDEFVVARAGDNFKIDGAAVVAAVTKHDVTLAGNTAGALALVSSGTLSLAGGNNITLSQAGNAVTISGANVGGAQTGISGLVGSDATYTSGTVTISGVGGGVTVNSNTGQRIDISVAAPVSQSVQTQNVVDVTLSGNTAGALALISSGTMTLAGGNNITVSQNGNAVTISGANVGGAQTGISGIANSETTYTSGTVSLSELGAITIRSTTGNQFQLSVNPQSVQPETQTFIGGISASDTLYTSGTVRLTGVGGGITVGTNTGQRIDLSVAAQSVQPETQTFIGGISASNTLYTSGSVRFSGSQAVTVRSGTGQLVIIDAPAQSVQPETQTAISGIANSQTTYTSGTVSLSELGAITIRSTTGNQFQLSVNAQSVQPETQTFIGGIGNSQTTYTSGTVNLSVVGGPLTIRSTTGNAFQFSASQSVQPETQTAISGIANSQTTYTSGTVSWSELGAVTIRSTTGQQFQISVNSQTVQTQGILNVALSNVGNTAGDTGINSGTRYVLAGGNNVTLSGSTAANATTVTISAAAQSVQTQDVLSVGISTGGNTAGNTTVNTGSRMVYVGSNMISLSQATAAGASTITFNATQSVQTQGVPNLGVSNVGNTSGDTGVNSGTRLVFAGGNNITLSQGTAANATTITISAPNLGAGAMSAGVSTGGNTAGDTGITGTQLVLAGVSPISLSQATGANGGTVSILAPATSSLSATGIVSISTNGSTISVGAPAYSGGMSTNGNTAGDTGYASQRLNLVGSNNITLSGSTNGGSMTISIVGGGGGGFSAGVSTGGNTAGSTGVTGTRLVLVGSNEITLSQSTDGDGATVSFIAPFQSSVMQWPGQPQSSGAAALTAANFNSAATRTTYTATAWPMAIEQHVQFNMARVPVQLSVTSATTNSNWSYTMGHSLGIYSLTGVSLSLISSFSNQQGISYTSTNNSTNATASWTMGFGSGAALSGSRSISTANAGNTNLWTQIQTMKWYPFQTGDNTIRAGQYWLLHAFSSRSTGANLASLTQIGYNTAANFNLHDVGRNVASTSAQYPLAGAITITQTNSGLPVSLATADVTQSTNVGSLNQRSIYLNLLSQFYAG